MIRGALWIIESTINATHWMVPHQYEMKDLYLHGILGVSTAPVWGTVAMAPYLKIASLQRDAAWAVADIQYAKSSRRAGYISKFKTMTFWNYAPRTRTFAARGGWRFAATKVGSRFLGPVGVVLLMIDAWTTGIWIGEQLFGEMED